MSPSPNAERGKRWERAVVAMLRLVPAFYQARTKRAGGETHPKDRGRDLLGTPGLCVQCKSGIAPPWRDAIDVATVCAQDDEMAVAFIHDRKSDPPRELVIMQATDFVAMMLHQRE